jgi:hypothetical protein
LRPSFSISSTSPWTKRLPRFTRVSEGNDFRRLRVTSKATEVFEIAMLAHGTPPSKKRPIAARGFYHQEGACTNLRATGGSGATSGLGATAPAPCNQTLDY